MISKRQRNENILGILEFFVDRMVTFSCYFERPPRIEFDIFFKILKTWNSMMQDIKKDWPESTVSAHENLLLWSWNSCLFFVTSHLELLVKTGIFPDEKYLIIIIFFNALFHIYKMPYMSPLYHRAFIHPTISIGIAKMAFGNTNASFDGFYLLLHIRCTYTCLKL